MKKIFLFLTAILLMASVSIAQSFAIGPTGGLTTIQSPDSFTKDVSEGGYGFGSEIHYGIKAKLGLPLLPLTITGQVVNTKFSNEYQGVELEQGLLIFGAGVEYGIIPIPGPVNPYLAFDIFYSNFGDFTSTTAVSENTIDGYSRTGIGVGAGIELTLLPMFNLEASAKYNFNNLIGKEDEEDSFNTLNLSASILYSIN